MSEFFTDVIDCSICKVSYEDTGSFEPCMSCMKVGMRRLPLYHI